MKPLNFICLLTATTLFAALLPLNAQSIEANVPFPFMVGDITLPAGEYTIVGFTDNEVAIRSEAGHLVSFSLTETAHSSKAVDPRLVFHRYNGQYFLAQVWLTESTDGRSFRASGHEIRLARNVRQEHVVQLAKR
jgi:hypothetical protein